jgi:hypothetical protein
MDPVLRSRSGQRGIESTYMALVSEAAEFGDRSPSSRIDRVSACDASAFLADEVIGSDWMLVGDSAVTLEPISGQGVQVAIKLGCQGAIVAHTLISDASSTPLAQMFYRNQCRATAARHAKATKQFYAGPDRFRREPFWRARAGRHNPTLRGAPMNPVGAMTPVRLSAAACLRDLPCLIGDRICLCTALDHPSVDSPISHLGNVGVAALLRETTTAQTAGELCRSWMRKGLTERPLTLLHWFLENGVLTPADGTT